MAAGDRVVLRNPVAAVGQDRFQRPSRLVRKIVVTVLCNLILFLLASPLSLLR